MPGIETKPTYTEIRFQIRDPGLFKPNAMRAGSTFVTITLQASPRVRGIIGKLKSSGKTAVQSLRFPKNAGWDKGKVAAWVKAHPKIKEEGRIEVGNVREALGQGRGATTRGTNMKKTVAQMRAETRHEEEIGATLEEHAFSEVKIEEEKGIVCNVAILGPKSKNRRTYLAETMAKAVPLYEGVRIFANHPREGESRSIRDLIGKITNPRFEGGKIRGDAQFLASHRSWVLPLIKEVPDLCGFSHDARGVVFVHKGEEVVEELKLVHSADLVVDPATTQGIFEEVKRKEEEERMELQEQIKGLTEEKTLLAVELEEKEKEIVVLQKDLDEAKVKEKLAQHKALVASLLKEAELPEAAVTDQFKATLEKAENGDEVKAIIEDRKKLVESSGGTGGSHEEEHPAAGAKPKIGGRELTEGDIEESVIAS